MPRFVANKIFGFPSFWVRRGLFDFRDAVASSVVNEFKCSLGALDPANFIPAVPRNFRDSRGVVADKVTCGVVGKVVGRTGIGAFVVQIFVKRISQYLVIYVEKPIRLPVLGGVVVIVIGQVIHA